MQDPQGLIIEILRGACKFGAKALNYFEVHDLLKSQNDVIGVSAIDKESGELHEFKARQVVNACGPWCRDLGTRFHRDIPPLFNASIAWNVLLNKEPLSDYALAVAPKKRGGQIYFLVPWNGKLFVGTGHAPWLNKITEAPMPSPNQLQEFFGDLNSAVPDLDVNQSDIIRIFSGFLPVQEHGSVRLTNREVILNHADCGGPKGLYSISGIKFTTARLVAQKTLNRIFHQKKADVKAIGSIFNKPQRAYDSSTSYSIKWSFSNQEMELENGLKSIIEEESVLHLDDLVLRRTSLWDNPSKALEIAPQICDFFDWDELRCKAEILRLKDSLAVPQYGG
jgi:glycerol-3-phosphate dehydrogenase